MAQNKKQYHTPKLNVHGELSSLTQQFVSGAAPRPVIVPSQPPTIIEE